MKIVPGNVGRIVAARVILAWAALSLLAGAATLYFELGRVNRMVLGLATNETKRFTEHIEAIAPEHAGNDAGKIRVGDTILLKPGPLTPAEMDAMRRHVSMGVGIIANSGWLRGARDIVELPPITPGSPTVGLSVGEPIDPAAVTPEGLYRAVRAPRGDWK